MVARGARQLVGAHRVLYAAQAVAIVGIRQVVDGAKLGGQRGVACFQRPHRCKASRLPFTS